MAANMAWSAAVEHIHPHIVRIDTPQSSGTGFLISNSHNNAFCGIATAAHVVYHAHDWEEPIRIAHVSKSIVIRSHQRKIFLDPIRDTATILFDRGELPLPPDPLSLIPKDKSLKVGTKVGWLGFPAIPDANLCFFEGSVSAWLETQTAYLIDGVAINGVSGGPAFHIRDGDHPAVVIIGVVSAYVPNRATGEVLPGLSVVQDVSHFHELAPTFASLDQAREADPPVPDKLPRDLLAIGRAFGSRRKRTV